jgi:ribonuclease R
VTSVAFKDRLDAHRLIEEFMVLANVAPPKDAGSRNAIPAALPRARGTAAREDRGAARDRQGRGFTLAKGQVLKTAQLNRLLRRPRAPSMTSSST